jgi:hypothetical protein
MLIIVLTLVISGRVTDAQTRFEGLHRVYFERLSGPGEKLGASPNVATRLPGFVHQPDLPSIYTVPQPFSDSLTVTDFEIDSVRSSRRLWIREVVDFSHPRIARSWWALYDDGERSDVWAFPPDPERTDGKWLSNYWLTEILTHKDGTAVFRVRGEMSRPFGAWWTTGKEWTFSVGDSAVTLIGVRNAFGFFQGYAISDSMGSYTSGTFVVSTELATVDGYTERRLEDPSVDLLRECGFEGASLEELWGLSWGQHLVIAQCATSGTAAAVSFRRLDSASFIEREK